MCVHRMAKASCEGQIGYLFPIFVKLIEQTENRFRFLYDPFEQKPVEPMRYIKGIDRANQRLTGNPAVGAGHRPVSVDGTSVDQWFQHKGFGAASILPVYRHIVFIYNVQDDSVIFLVEMMPVFIPVGRTPVDFYMPYQAYTGNVYHSIQKIGSFIKILRPCSLYMNGLLCHCQQIVLVKKTKIPDKLDNVFGKFHKAK